MTYREAEAHLLGLELFGMKFGLERMHRLMDLLGMPQRRFASIHVVGSNGKSSTVRFLAALLQRSGLRTGSYTSPHLASFRERIEVGEQPVAEERFAEAVERTLVGGDEVTQFEAITAAAYHELAASEVEVAVIEAGLGGRYDATNVIPSRMTVLTGVGLEHTRWLGPEIADIAGEKLAVLRDHTTLVVPSDLDPEAREVAERVAAERHARLVTAPMPEGPFQRRNFTLAYVAAAEFLDHAPDEAAVESAIRETRIPGRLDVVAAGPAHRVRRRPQPGRGAGAGRRAARGAGRSRTARAGGQRARRQGRRRHAEGPPAAVRSRRVHPLREPARAVPGDARVVHRKARRPAGQHRRRPARRRAQGACRSPGRKAPWWPPARST